MDKKKILLVISIYVLVTWLFNIYFLNISKIETETKDDNKIQGISLSMQWDKYASINRETLEDWKKYVVIEWDSMYPTLESWKYYETIEIEKATFKPKAEIWLDDWEIVAFDILWSDKPYIKRLVGQVWDKFEISENNILSIEGKQLIDFWANPTQFRLYRTLKKWQDEWVKEFILGRCLVLWDNFKNSIDSRSLWLITCDKISHVLRRVN